MQGGAHGAGKTALLSRLREIWDTDSAAPLPVLLDRKVLNSEEVLAEKIVGVLNLKKLPEFRQTVTQRLHADVKILGVGGETVSAMSTAPPNPSLDIVAEMFPLHEWKRPLCLMFDEMQNVIKPQVDVLEPLHLGTHGLPVVSVLAGLANTHAILGKHGLNHIADNATHKLGVLAFEEAAEAAEMFLDGFRIDRTSVGIDWPAEVAATSDGWPRHLHNSLQALVQELLTANGRLADIWMRTQCGGAFAHARRALIGTASRAASWKDRKFC